MKLKTFVIIGIVISLGLFWVVAPAIMKDKVLGLITFASAERQCFNYYKKEKDYFKDPDSAYIESSRILTKKDDKEELSQYQKVIEVDKVLSFKQYDSVVQIKVRARNSIGGYVSEDIYCPLVDKEFNKNSQTEYDVHYLIKKQIEIEELKTLRR